MNTVEPAYYGREQTAVKHRVLGRYLTPLPLIVGRSWVRDIVYVDCCSGPWNTVTDDLSDSSIGILLRFCSRVSAASPELSSKRVVWPAAQMILKLEHSFFATPNQTLF